MSAGADDQSMVEPMTPDYPTGYVPRQSLTTLLEERIGADKPRAFSSGATRSPDSSRYDPEGFMSPEVIERFCEYMNKNRIQIDGSIRASDNWQNGIPMDSYMKSMWRHFLHLWTRHRGLSPRDPMAARDIEEDLCALMFNTQGMLFEVLKAKHG